MPQSELITEKSEPATENTYLHSLLIGGGKLMHYAYTLLKVFPLVKEMTHIKSQVLTQESGDFLKEHEAIARTIACCAVSPIFTNPLDTVIARMQTKQPLPKQWALYYNGIYLAYLNTAIKIGVPMVLIPYFHKLFLEFSPDSNKYTQTLFSATAASFVESNISAPISGIKSLQQIYGQDAFTIFNAFDKKHLFRELYKSNSAMILRSTSFWAGFYSIENFLNTFSANLNSNEKITPFLKGITGISAGAGASFFSLPFDVLAKNMRVAKDYPTLIEMAAMLYNKNGISIFYTAYWITAARMSLIGLIFGLGTHYMPALFDAMSNVEIKQLPCVTSANRNQFFNANMAQRSLISPPETTNAKNELN